MATGTFKRMDVRAMCLRARIKVGNEIAKLAKREAALPRTKVNPAGTWRHWFFGPGGKVIDTTDLMLIQIDQYHEQQKLAQIDRIDRLCQQSDGEILLTDEELRLLNPT